MVDYLHRGFVGKTNVVLDLSSCTSLTEPAATTRKTMASSPSRMDPPLQDWARSKIHKYTQGYAKNTCAVFTSCCVDIGRINVEFLGILFLHAHREAEEHVKYILGMNGVAAQPNISDGYFKSMRAACLHALKCKTGLILAKAATMRINANL